MEIKLLFGVLLAVVHASAVAVASPEAKSAPQDNPPRKVLVGTVCRPFNGEPEQRAALVEKAVAELAGLADKRYGGRHVDLVVLPEHCIGRPGRVATEKMVPMDFVKKVVGGAAKRPRSPRSPASCCAKRGGDGPLKVRLLFKGRREEDCG